MIPNVNLNVPKIPSPKMAKVSFPKVNFQVQDFQVPDIWEGQEREPIPKATRMQVWKRRFVNRKSGKCYCCKERMVYIDAFLCGHRRAHAGRGSNNPENLEPICLRCNSKMGTSDLEPWCNKNYPGRLKGKKKSKKNVTKSNPEKTMKTKKKESQLPNHKKKRLTTFFGLWTLLGASASPRPRRCGVPRLG
jgi:hypothetical protein